MPLSALQRLRLLLQREAPAQAAAARPAISAALRSGNEASLVGAADAGPGSGYVLGDVQSVKPSAADRQQALLSGRPVLDMHTHPGHFRWGPSARGDEGLGPFRVAPSSTDFDYWRDKYGAQVRANPSAPQELRSLVVLTPDRNSGNRLGYNFFATDKPLAVFKGLDDARNELLFAAHRGKFRSVADDPRFREYFEYGGEWPELIEPAASLLLLKHRANQGLGRHELMPGGATLTPNPEATEERFMNILAPSALELLRQRKLAHGGAVRGKG